MNRSAINPATEADRRPRRRECASFFLAAALLAGCTGGPVNVQRHEAQDQAPYPPTDLVPFDLSTVGRGPGAPPAPPTPEGLAGADQRPGNPAMWGESARLGVGRQFDSVRFDSGSSTLDLNAQRKLQEYALWLNGHPRVWVVLAGHCDLATTPDFAYNLAQARSLEVMKYLNSQGVPAWRLFCIGYGASQPANAAKTPDAHAINNRVEVLPFLQPEGIEAPSPANVRDADSPGVTRPEPAPPVVELR